MSGQPAPRPPARGSRYGWFLGVVAVLVIAYVTLNTASTEGPGSAGPEAGGPLPPFAAPLASANVPEDTTANVRDPRLGDQGEAAGSRPACEVRGRGILNSCQLAERGPVVLGFLATRGGDCTRAFDRLEDLRRARPGLQVAAVAVRGERGDLRRLARTRRWGFPVAYDADGRLANLYGVAVCPHVTFARWGGRVDGTAVGRIEDARLVARADRLLREARGRGWEPPR